MRALFQAAAVHSGGRRPSDARLGRHLWHAAHLALLLALTSGLPNGGHSCVGPRSARRTPYAHAHAHAPAPAGARPYAGLELKWPTSCGSAAQQGGHGRSRLPRPYIVNGQTQVYGEFPSYARLIIKRRNSEPNRCGGTLITDRHVLTTAACLGGDGSDVLGGYASQMYVGLRQHSLTYPYEHGPWFKVSSMCVAPQHIVQVLGVDWALVELDRPVKLDAYAQPACLPRDPKVSGQQLPATNGSESKCYLVGSGYDLSGTEEFINPEAVQKIQVEQTSCKIWDLPADDPSRACYVAPRNYPGGLCKGDAGGPVLCQNSAGHWTVMGMASYTTDHCTGKSSRGWVGVYTDIRKVLPDIEKFCMGEKSAGYWVTHFSSRPTSSPAG